MNFNRMGFCWIFDGFAAVNLAICLHLQITMKKTNIGNREAKRQNAKRKKLYLNLF